MPTSESVSAAPRPRQHPPGHPPTCSKSRSIACMRGRGGAGGDVVKIHFSRQLGAFLLLLIALVVLAVSRIASAAVALIRDLVRRRLDRHAGRDDRHPTG